MGLIVEIRGCYSLGTRADGKEFRIHNVKGSELKVDVVENPEDTYISVKHEDVSAIGHCIIIGLVDDEVAKDYQEEDYQEIGGDLEEFKKEMDKKFQSEDRIDTYEIEWYEKTDRSYTASLENEWKNMYRYESGVFSVFEANPIVDVPAAKQERILEFLIILKTIKGGTYLVIARQKVISAKEAQFSVKLACSIKCEDVPELIAELELNSYGGEPKKTGTQNVDELVEKVRKLNMILEEKVVVVYNKEKAVQFEEWSEEK